MAAVILVAFVGLIVEHGTVNSKINDHKVVQQMVNDSDELSAEEKAVVLEKKLDWNRDLSKYKYYDKSDWVGIFYPSKVAKLPYIK
ncbi:hypothetical protein [Bacillus paranthracis]|uniref:hypothetical protein n=1 Tax=Bacillus paranthracis TaxID=2026186 RepID=UPI0022E63CFB|nr:hypothetical protein [Bacillus paranthracis]